jgi:two-component sensor histidine kinase
MMDGEGQRLIFAYGHAHHQRGRTRDISAVLFLPLITSLILLIPTILYWAHERSVFAEFQQTRVAQYRLRLAKRIQTEVDSQLRPLRRLANEVSLGDVPSPAAFSNSARSICREEPALQYIAWIGLDGRCISAFPSSASAAVSADLFGAHRAAAAQLYERLAGASDGMLLSFPFAGAPRAADRLIVLPIARAAGLGQAPSGEESASSLAGAIVTCETTQAMLGALIPPDAISPFIVEVKDERGHLLFASDGATTPAAADLLRKQDVDQIRVLDQFWSMIVAAAPPGLGQRPAGDTDAFLLSGLIVALLGGATMAQAVRHRLREQQRTSEHLAALEALHAVAASISCKPRAEGEVLERLLAAACQLLHMPRAFVCEVEAGKPARLSRAVGFDRPTASLEQALIGLPIIERSIRTGQMLADENVRSETASSPPAATDSLRIESVFAFPLSAGEDRIGVMALCDGRPRRFTDEDFRLARLWASQAAVTLANQRLAAANDEALQQQQRLNQQVRHDADAKAMLLRELNHRVKNNLAGIVGLLSAGVPELSEQAQQWLDRAIARIGTLARAHELFVGTSSERLSEVGLADLIAKTLEPIWAIKPAGVQIKLDLSSVNDPLSTDQAVTLAMVVHELASNALQHGIGEHGTVLVRGSRPRPGWATIEVTDDGLRSREGPQSCAVAEPSGVDEATPAIATLVARETRTGIGLQIVRGLVTRELHGRFSLEENAAGGTIAIVEFPINVETTPVNE